MDITQVTLLVIVAQTLIIIALLLIVFGQGRQLGGSYPADVKGVLGALAGLAVFFAARTASPLDDTVISSVLLPIFKLLGIDVLTVRDDPPAGGGTTPAGSSVPGTSPSGR